MSMKKFFIALLAMILCFSMLLTACGDAAKNDKDKAKEEETGDVDEKQIIIDSIAAFNIKNIVDTVLSSLESGNTGNMNEMVGQLFDMIKATNAEANMNLTIDGETGNIYAGIKDGIFQGHATNIDGEDGKVYVIVNENGLLGFNSMSNGSFEIDGITDFNQYLFADDSMSMVMDQINAILTDEVMNVLGEFKLPELKKEDLTKEGDFYYISNSYYGKVVEAAFDLVVDFMEAAGMADALPSKAEMDAVLGMVDGVVEALNLKVGFAAGNSSICGFAISADVNINDLAAYFGGSSDVEAMPTEEKPSTVKVSLEALCTKDLKAPKYFHAAADINVEGASIDVSANVDAILGNNNEFKGLDVKVSADVLDVVLSTYSDIADEYGSYYYTKIFGDVNVSFEGKIDISDLDSINAKLAEFDLNVAAIATDAKSYDDYGQEYEITSVNLADYSTTVTSSGSVTVKSKGSADIGFELSIKDGDYETDAQMNGTLNWLSAPNYAAIPSEINESIISKFTAAKEKAEEIRQTAYDPYSYEDDWRSFLYYDASTGLYIVLTGEYEGYTDIFLGQPPEYAYDYTIN